MDSLPEILQPWFAALIDIALAGCAGGATFLGGIASSASARFARCSLILLVIGLLAYLWAGGMAMSGAPIEQSFPAVRTTLLQTSFGATIVISALGCSVSACALFLPGLEQGAVIRRIVMWAGLTVICYARAATGHAMDSGWMSLAVLAHAVHVLAGSVWVGSVVLCTWLAFKWKAWGAQERIALAHRVSQAATLALIAVLISGGINTWRMLGGADLTLSDPYVRLLAWKLLLVLAAMCMGAANRWLVMPRLRGDLQAASVRFGRVLLVEGVVLAIVLIMAARLGTLMPP